MKVQIRIDVLTPWRRVRPGAGLRDAALRALAASALACALAGCSSTPLRVNPVPKNLHERVQVPGIPDARYWGDVEQRDLQQWFDLPDAELAARYSGIMNRPHHYLALSGGGSNGAFGAGLIVGWTARGDRPEFTIVSGISTGALIAPFAFLGPRYDNVLRHVYTELATANVVEERSLIDILRGDSAFSVRLLREQIERYIDDEVVALLAAEHRRGRALLIGTTNLDAARPVTWNVTRIAASGAPGARSLIHDVILASASIPGAFPPVMIGVEAAGQSYEEMHVDGGVTAQVFIYPTGLDWARVARRLGIEGRPQLYVIRNSHGQPDWQSVERRVIPILSRSVDSLIRTQGIGDIATIYFLARRDGIDFHLAHIPDDFTDEPTELFDRKYMSEIFQLGYERARGGYPWTTGAK